MSADLVAWVRGLTREQLEDAESACACWPTRAGAAEALRRALIVLASGKAIDRRAISAEVESMQCRKCEGRGYVYEDPDQPECGACGCTGMAPEALT